MGKGSRKWGAEMTFRAVVGLRKAEDGGKHKRRSPACRLRCCNLKRIGGMVSKHSRRSIGVVLKTPPTFLHPSFWATWRIWMRDF